MIAAGFVPGQTQSSLRQKARCCPIVDAPLEHVRFFDRVGAKRPRCERRTPARQFAGRTFGGLRLRLRDLRGKHGCILSGRDANLISLRQKKFTEPRYRTASLFRSG